MRITLNQCAPVRSLRRIAAPLGGRARHDSSTQSHFQERGVRHHDAEHKLEETQGNIIPLVFRKGMPGSPAFHLQVRNDVLAGRCGCLVTPKLPHFLDPGLVMPLLSVSHPLRWPPGKLVQPPVNLSKWLAEKSDGFLTMFIE